MSRTRDYKNKEWLYQKYVKEKLSTRKISTLCGYSHNNIRYWLKKFDIEIRETQRNNKCKDREWLYQKYIIERLSREAIGKLIGMSDGVAGHWLKKFKIPMRKPWEVLSETNFGEKASNWKGGRTQTSEGYIYIYSPNHPHKRKTSGSKTAGYVLEHRLVMEKHLGRYLHPWETVHHKNGIKDDNRIENLKLLPGNEHNTKVQEVYKENQFLRKIVSDFMSIEA